MPDLAYEILDVFTDTPLSGNPLAVVHDADALGSERMQAIAGEFNLSETVFLVAAEAPGHSARARIFTPRAEIPFAGHPTVGAAIAIARRAAAGAPDVSRMVTLEEGIGTVRCVVRGSDTEAAFAEFDLPRLPAVLDAAPPPDRVAAALGLAGHEVGFGHFPVAVADAGLPFVCVPVNGLAAIRKARPAVERWEETFAPDHDAVYLFTAETERPGASYHARMFAPTHGIMEDPATGSAVAALGGVLARFGALVEGPHEVLVEQGIEIGRPSLVRLELEVADEGIHAARLGGHAVRVAEGTLRV